MRINFSKIKMHHISYVWKSEIQLASFNLQFEIKISHFEYKISYCENMKNQNQTK